MSDMVITRTKFINMFYISIVQAALDAARDAVNKPREAFRQKYLEAERKRQEDLEAQEAKMKADLEAKSPKGKKNSAKGKKSPTGKKSPSAKKRK